MVSSFVGAARQTRQAESATVPGRPRPTILDAPQAAATAGERVRVESGAGRQGAGGSGAGCGPQQVCGVQAVAAVPACAGEGGGEHLARGVGQQPFDGDAPHGGRGGEVRGPGDPVEQFGERVTAAR
ncbi:hypothetical protein ACF06W_02265 [Streptomyces albus]|uniref:hypothetical protein n=1 Tax=Streptomyces albus TaxID=1888 RepID=UPI0036FC8E8E